MSDIAATFLAFSVKRMEQCEQTIFTCLGKLSEEQVWERGGEHENSIANLLLHLEGNLRQWVLHGIDGQPDVRQRDDEFAARGLDDSADYRARFLATLAASRNVIGALTAERLMATIDPQPGGGWGKPTALEGVYRVVGHLQEHTAQIILLTKQMTGRDLDLTIPRKR